MCLICVSLELECHGYGDRPLWMDSGPLQKEQALKVKRAVSRNNSQRRKRRLGCQDSERRLEMDIAHEEMSSNSEAPSNYSADRAQLRETGWDVEVQANVPPNEAQFHIWNMNLDMNLFDKDISMAFPEENLFTAQSFFNNPGWANKKGVDDELTNSSGQKGLSLPVNRDYDETGPKSILTPKISNLQKAAGEQRSGVPEEEKFAGENNTSGVGWSRGSKIATGPLLDDTTAMREAAVFDYYLEEPTLLRQDKEDMLLLHYLDEIFYTQYPFYSNPHKQFRSWLFSIIRRVPSVYHATLALSECHMESITANCRITTKPKEKDYYTLALHEVEVKVRECSSLSGRARLVQSLENLACISQILFYEVSTTYNY